MSSFATLRLNWEPRMLSILRIMVGLLYMEHAKILGFPHQPNHSPYALLTLVPGLQGLLELVGGLLLALGLFTRTVAFVLAGNMAVAYFMAHAPRGFFRCSTAASWQSSTVSCSSISGLPAVANGASIGYVRPPPHPSRRRAEPELRRTTQKYGNGADRLQSDRGTRDRDRNNCCGGSTGRWSSAINDPLGSV